MIDLRKTYTVIEPNNNEIINILKNFNVYKYSNKHIEALREMLMLKYQTKRNIIIDNGSAAIIEKLIIKYDNFIIQKNDFFMFEESMIKYKKSYTVLGENFLDDLLEKTNENNEDINEKNNKYKFVTLFSIVNNFDGKEHNVEKIIEVAQKRKDVLFIVDGAYREYSHISDKDISIMLNENNIVYLGTFSKAYGIAGFRVGYMIGSLLEEIPYTISSLSALMAINQLQTDFLKKNIDYIKKEQEKFLKTYPAFTITNHKVILKHKNAEMIQSLLKEKGLLVNLIDETHISFSISKIENNQILRDELINLLKIYKG